MWDSTATKEDQRRASIRRAILYVVVFVLVLSAYLYGRSQSPAGVSPEDQESVALYVEALEAVKGDYVDQEAVDSEELAYGAIEGMLDSLGDKGHTRFLSPEEVERNEEVISSKYVGVGIRLENKDDEIVVAAPMDGSPAKDAGIESGDVIIAVDGESVQEEDFRELGEKIRGPEGSLVDLTVLRDEDEREFSLERAELEAPVVSWSLIPSTDTAHLRLSTFSKNSAEKLKGAIGEAQEAGAQRFVLDLRDNTGGLVDQAEEIAALFLPEGSGVYIRKDADGEEEATTVPEGNEPLDAPLVVLVNKGSASSAEILAGAIRDNDRGKVVGETTFGTGTMLAEHDLNDGSAILLGVAEWLTPNGDYIRDSGIEPDVEAELGEEGELLTPDEYDGSTAEDIFAEDAQLESAFEVLREE